MSEAAPPPANTRPASIRACRRRACDGPLLWIKENLFGSVANTLLTALSIWLLWVTIPPLLHWAFIDAAFTGESRKDCRAVASGACWAFIQNRFELFVYGFYPRPERWRVNLSRCC